METSHQLTADFYPEHTKTHTFNNANVIYSC